MNEESHEETVSHVQCLLADLKLLNIRLAEHQPTNFHYAHLLVKKITIEDALQITEFDTLNQELALEMKA